MNDSYYGKGLVVLLLTRLYGHYSRSISKLQGMKVDAVNEPIFNSKCSNCHFLTRIMPLQAYHVINKVLLLIELELYAQTSREFTKMQIWFLANKAPF